MEPMCIAAWALALLLLPLIVLLWATESKEQRVRRLKAKGMSQQTIADHMGISRHQVRRALA